MSLLWWSKSNSRAPQSIAFCAIERGTTRPRGQRANAPSTAPVRCLAQLATYDAFHNVEIFLTQPLQIIAGSKAGSRWMSEDVYKRAASKSKNLHIVEGASQVGLYDKPDLVAEAMSNLAPFFKKNLVTQEVTLPATA